MKRLLFFVGVLFLFVGIVLAVNYSSWKLARAREIVADQRYGTSWEISGNLTAGDFLRVLCTPGQYWENGPFEVADDYCSVPHRHIWFYIYDPNGRVTEYNTAWTTQDTSGEQIPLSRVYVNVTVRDGIEAEQYPYYIGGNVTLDGTYRVKVDQEFDPSPFIPSQTGEIGAPIRLAIEKEYPVKVYPYMYFLPTGMSFSIIGIVISTWATRSRKQKKRSLRKF